MYDYKGVIHLHSNYSYDGVASVEEIMQCANDAGLDFVILTDHDSIQAMIQKKEKWYGGCLLIVGAEVSPIYNHYIIFGEGPIKDVDILKIKSPQEFINEVNEKKWIGFIAHPDRKEIRRFGIPSCRWNAWEVEGFTGLEVWDFMTDWLEKVDTVSADIDLYKNFSSYLTGPKPETLSRWDKLCLRHPVVGICSLDNHKHQVTYKSQKIVVFPYEQVMGVLVNHIILEEPLPRGYEDARALIVEAISSGQLYFCFETLGDPVEFNFAIEEAGESAYMGETLEFKKEAEGYVSISSEAEIIVKRNGEVVEHKQASEVIFSVEQKGVYRVEVRKNRRPWIFSNPIYVR